MSIYLIFNFLKKQWLGSILIIIFVLVLLYGNIKREEMLKEKQRLETEIKKLEKKESIHWSRLDSLKVSETTINNREKILIKIQHDTVKIIDSMSISELQEYFSNRYFKKDSTR